MNIQEHINAALDALEADKTKSAKTLVWQIYPYVEFWRSGRLPPKEQKQGLSFTMQATLFESAFPDTSTISPIFTKHERLDLFHSLAAWVTSELAHTPDELSQEACQTRLRGLAVSMSKGNGIGTQRFLFNVHGTDYTLSMVVARGDKSEPDTPANNFFADQLPRPSIRQGE